MSEELRAAERCRRMKQFNAIGDAAAYRGHLMDVYGAEFVDDAYDSHERDRELLADAYLALSARLATAEGELADLKRRMREIHKWRCEPDNCNLDGGPEHEEYFAGGGVAFREELARRPAGPNGGT